MRDWQFVNYAFKNLFIELERERDLFFRMKIFDKEIIIIILFTYSTHICIH